MRLGFACAWDDPPEKTWSYTPWHLRAALARQAEVVDAGIQLSHGQRKVLEALHLRLKRGRLISYYGPSWLRDRVNQHLIGHAARLQPYDILLQMDDLAIPRMPFYLYQDLCYAALLELLDSGQGLWGFSHLNYDIIARRVERQQKVYARATGIFAMSHWLAGRIRTLADVPQSKLHVVHAGTNAPCAGRLRPARPAHLRKKLLFIGRDFHRKGGDLVVQAAALLRQEYDPDIQLTLVGLDQWPLRGAPPPGVQLMGPMAPAQVADLMALHDLLVIPSRFEPFGIAFVEALAAGLPCIGRNAFAMPEIIQNGRNGALLVKDDAHTLAEVIQQTLHNDFIYAHTARNVAQVHPYYDWDRVAADMLSRMAGTGM